MSAAKSWSACLFKRTLESATQSVRLLPCQLLCCQDARSLFRRSNRGLTVVWSYRELIGPCPNEGRPKNKTLESDAPSSIAKKKGIIIALAPE